MIYVYINHEYKNIYMQNLKCRKMRAMYCQEQQTHADQLYSYALSKITTRNDYKLKNERHVQQ